MWSIGSSFLIMNGIWQLYIKLSYELGEASTKMYQVLVGWPPPKVNGVGAENHSSFVVSENDGYESC